MIYACCDLQRREAVIDDAVLNGIDYLEVIDHDLPDNDPLRQRTLLVHCFKPLPANLSADNVQLLGGERIANVQVLWAAVASPAPTALTAPGSCRPPLTGEVVVNVVGTVRCSSSVTDRNVVEREWRARLVLGARRR